METNFDIIVVGGGISGLGAALKLHDAGKKVLVLEKENRVGGRVSTDRFDGFAIDTGATLLGGRFKHLKYLIKRLHLEEYAEEIDFSFELHDGKTKKKIRRTRFDDLLFNPALPLRAKWALIKFGIQAFWYGRKLDHGNALMIENLDNMSTEEYFKKLGGKEVLDHFLIPGLNGPLCGNLRKDSRVILMQTFWNIILTSPWAVRGGMSRITEAMKKELNVRTNAIVTNIDFEKDHVTVTVNDERYTANRVIIALPGHQVPKICNQLPEETKELLRTTTYGTMINAHVMLNQVPETTCAAVGLDERVDCGYEMVVEHNRARELCREGKGLVSIYMWDENKRVITDKNDEEIKHRAEEIIRDRFPECANGIIATHIVRWKPAIGHIPPGRLTKMCKLRRQMKDWDLPIQLCGDYLDGIASESALATGVQAAENILTK
jgi:protoporphyrinogen/coproporphyrinogen III oxidase